MSRRTWVALPLALALVAPGLARRYGGGIVFLPEEEYRALPLATAPKTGSLPRRVDLSRWFPGPGNQGKASTCVGWSLAYGLKSYQEARERGRRPRGRRNQFSPAFLFNQLNPDECSSGTFLSKGLDLLKAAGVSTLESFPYTPDECVDQPDQELKRRALPQRILSWRRLGRDTVVAETKAQLASEFPVVIGMRIGDRFETWRSNKVYDGEEHPAFGHAMVVCGYDQRKQAFRIFNSWGPRWGDKGLAWVSYDAFRNQVVSAYVTQDWVTSGEAPGSPEPPKPAEPAEPSKPPKPTVRPAPTRPAVRPSPAPPAPPPPAALAIRLDTPVVEHSIPMKLRADAEETYLGMRIRVPGEVRATQASRFHLVVRFFHPDGTEVRNERQFGEYFDPRGQAAVSSPVMTVDAGQSIDPGAVAFHIPYEALGIPAERSFTPRRFQVVVHGFWNDFEHATSEPSTVEFYW
jgi:hypothetical protein